jgi:hypothetical protein
MEKPSPLDHNLLANIPAELLERDQWVVWRYENPGGGERLTKVPYSVRGYRASCNDRRAWASSSDAWDALMGGDYDGIGFVLSWSDPYTILDFDACETQEEADEQMEIHDWLDSYSEVSPSGEGLHIVVRGNLPKGFHGKTIGAFNKNRYICFTGNVYNNVEIKSCTKQLAEIYAHFGANCVSDVTIKYEPEKYDDDTILEMAENASNGEKFIRLYKGDWHNEYTSQSEADYALIDMIGFYTHNHEQIKRIFQHSELGNRPKFYQKGYVDNMIVKSQDNVLPDVLPIKNPVVTEAPTEPEDAQPEAPTDLSYHTPIPCDKSTVSPFDTQSYGTDCPAYPPGLVGDIAKFILASSPIPVPIIALTGALGMMAGLCGQSYNISGTGLNQYICMLAMTGSGKEAMAGGISKIEHAMRLKNQNLQEFMGPSEVASPQGLIKYLQKNSCVVSIFGEFAHRLKQMHSQHVNENQIGLKRVLLDLYNKSGANDVLKQIIYSDKEKNTQSILAPAYSLLCESAPELFWKTVDDTLISDGLIPRFLILEYKGKRNNRNKLASMVMPSPELINTLNDLAGSVKQYRDSKKYVNIGMTDLAEKMGDDYSELCTNNVNAADNETQRHLWTRAHVKVLKLAGLIAVGISPYNPVVCENCIDWAINLVNSETENVLAHFRNHDIGDDTSDNKMFSDLERVIKEYLHFSDEKIKKNSSLGVDANLHSLSIIPHSYILKRVSSLSCFKNSKRGAIGALQMIIQSMIASGVISKLSEKTTLERYNSRRVLYQILDPRSMLGG